jgi:hypothetical protein
VNEATQDAAESITFGFPTLYSKNEDIRGAKRCRPPHFEHAPADPAGVRHVLAQYDCPS